MAQLAKHYFSFEKPQALSSITEGEITGMRMIDSEGEIFNKRS